MLNRVFNVDVAVHGQLVALAASAGKDCGKLGRFVVGFVRVQAHAHDPLLVRQRLQQRSHGVFGLEVAQETHDELAKYAQGLLGLKLGAAQTRNHGVEADPTAGVCLGVKENFCVTQSLACGLAVVGHGQVIEVFAGEQHVHAVVVGV